ncbi:MAG: hypothetical protein AUJ58_03235 [Zetaproteobacteria bacterium CG1_02_55_237]|nr:MAG: hypothetical protein AUJ58_03235 [Zetaproteobacteria bacterium CG1_02_55_237]
MKRYWMLLLILAGVLPAGLISPERAQGAAFAALDMSAGAAGAGNAFTATADDPTAMHYNPAGLAWQPGVNLAFSGALRFENQSVQQTAARGTPYNDKKLANLAGLYGNWMPEGSNWGLGFAFDTPYALSTGWGTAFGGVAKSTSFDALHVGLDTVYAASSSLAVAVGGDWYLAKGEVSSTVTTFSGRDKAGFGGHISALWHPRPAWAIGAMLKSGATIKLSGTASGAVNGNASVKVKLPDVARIGAMHVFNDKLRIEVDTSWTRWSRQKNLDVVGSTAELNPLSLRDSFALMTGATWFWRENTTLRFGYAFDQAASKDGGFNARIADANMHRVSLGAGADMIGVHFDLAYVYSFAAKRTINNASAFDGTYRNRRQSLALSVGKHF